MLNIDPKILAGAEDDVKALNVIHKKYWEEPRYQILKKFCKAERDGERDGERDEDLKILSVGCGPREPLIIDATHACDITSFSDKFLKSNGWDGIFTLAPCTELPYQSKYFDIVVCSEVIEHLPEIKDVIKTFKEVARCGKKWIIDTPNTDIIKPKNQNKHHKLFFTVKSLNKIVSKIPYTNYKLYAYDHHIYVESV